MLVRARAAAAMSQAALAKLAGTSRPTLSAYERGHKSPTLATVQRILAQAGFDLALAPKIKFREVALERGRSTWVPQVLPRLPVEQALATVTLPLHLNWSDHGRSYDLRDRHQRARVYEIVLREGVPEDLCTYLDGVLLADVWPELVLPPAIRAAWHPVVMGSVLQQVTT